MALRRRPNYEDQNVRYSIWPGFHPETGYVGADLISHIPTPLADGAGHTFPPPPRTLTSASHWATKTCSTTISCATNR